MRAEGEGKPPTSRDDLLVAGLGQVEGGGGRKATNKSFRLVGVVSPDLAQKSW